MMERRQRGRILWGVLLIVFGLAAGIAVEGENGVRNGAAVVGGLGLGFVAIYVVDGLVTRAARWWPLIPGAILLMLSAALWTGSQELLRLLGTLWPVGLILLGVFVLYQYWREEQQ